MNVSLHVDSRQQFLSQTLAGMSLTCSLMRPVEVECLTKQWGSHPCKQPAYAFEPPSPSTPIAAFGFHLILKLPSVAAEGVGENLPAPLRTLEILPVCECVHACVCVNRKVVPTARYVSDTYFWCMETLMKEFCSGVFSHIVF